MELNFSFSKPKVEEPEKYPNVPVLTFVSGGNVTKFKLNKKACELMNYTEDKTYKINFGKTSEDDLFIANTNGNEQNNLSNVNRDKTLNNKKLFERMEGHFGISIEEGAEFALATVDGDFGFPVLLITNGSPESHTSDDFRDFPDDSFENEIAEEESLTGTLDADPNTSSLY